MKNKKGQAEFRIIPAVSGVFALFLGLALLPVVLNVAEQAVENPEIDDSTITFIRLLPLGYVIGLLGFVVLMVIIAVGKI